MQIARQIDAAGVAATGLAASAGVAAGEAIQRVVGEIGARAAIVASGEASGTLKRADRVDANGIGPAGTDLATGAAVVRVAADIDAGAAAAGIAIVVAAVAGAVVIAGDAAGGVGEGDARTVDGDQRAKSERGAFEEAAAARGGGEGARQGVESLSVHDAPSLVHRRAA